MCAYFENKRKYFYKDFVGAVKRKPIIFPIYF